MSEFIDIDLDETPDNIPQVEAGVHLMECVKHEVKEDKNGNDQQVFVWEVKDENDSSNGRRIYDRFNLGVDFSAVKFKKMLKACGHTGTGKGVDPADVIGKLAKVKVKTTVSKDNDGEVQEYRNVAEYLPA